MTLAHIRWSDTDWSSPCHFLPAQIILKDSSKVLIEGDEWWVPEGPATLVTEGPYGNPKIADIRIFGPTHEILLDCDDVELEVKSRIRELGPVLIRADRRPGDASYAQPTAVNVQRSGERPSLVLSRSHPALDAVDLTLTDHKTPPRRLSVPAVGYSGYDLHWTMDPVTERGSPSLSPMDDGGRLMLAYMERRRFDFAAAVARASEARIGDSSIAEWSIPSYTQLLRGYAYALDHDLTRLRAWSRRTMASKVFGSDGMLLEAYGLSLEGRLWSSLSLVARAGRESPPILVMGFNLGYQALSALMVQADGRPAWSPDDRQRFEYVAATALNPWLNALGDSAANSPTLSLSATRSATIDASLLLLPARLYWRMRFLLLQFGRRYTAITSKGPEKQIVIEGDGMSTSRSGSISPVGSQVPDAPNYDARLRVAMWIVLLLWTAGWLALIFFSETWSNPAFPWEAFCVLQAAAAFGLGMGLDHFYKRGYISELKDRCDRAERLSVRFRQEAVEGRAFAAAIQADGLSEDADQSLRRHATLSRGMFGGLVVSSSEHSETPDHDVQ